MADLFGGLVKGLSNLMPQDDPDVKIFNAQNELGELQKQEADLYAQIGRQAYTDAPDAWPQGAKLQLLQANIAQAQDTLGRLKAEKNAAEAAAEAARAAREAEEAKFRCQNCDTQNPEGTRFCQECGTPLAVAAAPVKAAFCTGCGAALAPGMRFCGECGAKQE